MPADLEVLNERLIAVVTEQPGASCFTVARELGLDPSHAEVRLDALCLQGRLTTKDGGYCLREQLARLADTPIEQGPPGAKGAPRGEHFVRRGKPDVEIVYQRR